MKLAEYLRYSSDMQRHESIEAQHRANSEWAKREGHIIVKSYIDEAKTGTNDNRENFQKMIADSDKKDTQWEGLVVHKIDRFARNRYDSAVYKKKLKDNKKTIFYSAQDLGDSTAAIMMESVLEGMAEYYSANLAEEVKKGHKENAIQCKHNGGIPLLGYDVDENLYYIINEQEAEIVRLIFDRYAKGFTVTKIIKELNEKGYKTKRGDTFGKNSIYDLVRNEKYIGTYTFGCGNRRKIRGAILPNSTRIENGMPAIIEKEVFEMVQSRIKNNKGGGTKASHVYLLTGILFCGKCGESYIGKSSKGYSKYGCKRRINKVNCDNLYLPKNDIEDYVIDNMYNIIDSEISNEFVEEVNQQYKNSKGELEESIVTTTANIASIKIKTRNILNAISSGIFNNTIKEELDSLEKQQKIFEEKMTFLEKMKNFKEISRKDIMTIVQKDILTIRSLSEEEQKNIIKKYIKKILVYPDKIEITFNINDEQVSGKKNAMSISTHSYGSERGT